MQFVPSGTFLQPQQSPTYEMFPHRVFVGGFPVATTEGELREHFEQYGQVREVKIIRTPDGLSKGYGFVSTETEEEADAIRNWGPEKLEFKGKKLNIGPALRRLSTCRYPSEYTVATPTGLVPAASLGYSYAVNPPFVMMPSVMFNTPPNTAKISGGPNSAPPVPVAASPGQPYFFNASHQMSPVVSVPPRSQQFYAENHPSAFQPNFISSNSEVSHSSEQHPANVPGGNNVSDKLVANSNAACYPYTFYVQQPAQASFVANTTPVYPAGVPYFGISDCSGTPANMYGMGFQQSMISPVPMNYSYPTSMTSGDSSGVTASLSNVASTHDDEVFTPGKYPRSADHSNGNINRNFPAGGFATPISMGPGQHSATKMRTPVYQANKFAEPARYSRAARRINLLDSAWGDNLENVRSSESKESSLSAENEDRFAFSGRMDMRSRGNDGQQYNQSTFKTNKTYGRFMHIPSSERNRNAALGRNRQGVWGNRSVSGVTSQLSTININDNSKPDLPSSDERNTTTGLGTAK